MSDLRQQLQSTLGNAYTIEREVGGGGMSRVFLATEQSLGRLGRESTPERARFERLVAELKFPLWSLAVGEERKLRFVAPRLGLRPSVVSQRAARALPDE